MFSAWIKRQKAVGTEGWTLISGQEFGKKILAARYATTKTKIDCVLLCAASL